MSRKCGDSARARLRVWILKIVDEVPPPWRQRIRGREGGVGGRMESAVVERGVGGGGAIALVVPVGRAEGMVDEGRERV